MAESIFTSEVPAATNVTDGAPYTLGTVWTPAISGVVTGIRLWAPENTDQDHLFVGILFSITGETTGIELARKQATVLNPNTWNVITFDAPVAVTGGSYYVAAYFTPDYFVLAQNLFTASGVTNGNLTAIQDGQPYSNGRINTTGDGFPNTAAFADSCYFADVVFEANETIEAPLIGSASTVYQPALSSVATVSAPHVGSTAQVQTPALTNLSTVAAPLMDSTAAVYASTVSSLATVLAPFVASGAAVYGATVLAADTQLIAPPLIASTAAARNPRVYGGGRLAPLASIEDLEALLGRELTAAEQAQALLFLEYASDFIREYTGRSFEYRSNHLIRIQADAHGIIDLPDPPIHAVATVLDAEDDEEIDGWRWDQMWRLSCIPAWRTCKVTYTHGFVDVPPAIVGVVASMAARQFINPAGIRQETVGAISVTYASVFGEAGAIGLSGMERQVLERYRDSARSWRI